MKWFRKETYGTPTTYYYWGDKEIGRKTDREVHLFNERYVGWHDWKLDITWRECGYSDGYGRLHISLFGWHSIFKTRIKSKRFPHGDCDEPTYGIQVHDNTLWIMRGGNGNTNGRNKWWTWDIPFFTWKHIRHQVECKDGILKDSKDLMRDSEGRWIPVRDNPELNVHEYMYTDSYDDSKIPCKYWIEEREWRPKWLTWTGLFKKVKRYIEIDFEQEVGKEKGSWKGGCVGCSYNLLPGETADECIRRMERERKF